MKKQLLSFAICASMSTGLACDLCNCNDKDNNCPCANQNKSEKKPEIGEKKASEIEEAVITPEIQIATVPDYKVIGLREKGSYTKVAEMTLKLYEHIIKNTVQPIGAPIFICHENGPQEALEANKNGTADLEVCLPITGDVIDESGEFKVYDLPGGQMAKIVHKGPYNECSKSYEILFAWIAQNGYHVVGNAREVYINNPQEVKPEDILTEIYVPVAKK